MASSLAFAALPAAPGGKRGPSAMASPRGGGEESHAERG